MLDYYYVSFKYFIVDKLGIGELKNQFKITLASTNLGLDHINTPSFQQVIDGFGHSLEHGRDLSERMVTHKHSYTSYSC